MFGYTDKLNPLVTKKEIRLALKDLKLLRKNPDMYPTENLNVWEHTLPCKKFRTTLFFDNWLKLYDRDINIDTNVNVNADVDAEVDVDVNTDVNVDEQDEQQQVSN